MRKLENSEEVKKIGYELSDLLINFIDEINPDRKIDLYKKLKISIEKMNSIFPPMAEAYKKMLDYVIEEQKANRN